MVCGFDLLGAWLAAPAPERATHTSSSTAVFVLIGYSIGLGNFWRFPYLCFKHDGATFLIPYFLALFCFGIPLYFMELALGQYVSLASTQLFTFICPVFSGLGYGMVFIMFAIVIYYNVIMAWTIFYIGASAAFSSVLPWANCEYEHMLSNCSTDPQGRLVAAKYYYEYIVLNKPIGDEIQNGTNEVHLMMVACLAVAWFLVALCLAGGIKMTGKILIVTVIYPYIMLSLIWAWSYDKTKDDQLLTSKKNFSQLNTTRLLHDPEIWNDAATQVIYSLGIAYGGITTLASYNKLHQNILRDTFIVCLLDTLTSIFCAFVVFSISGYLTDDIIGEEGSTSALVFIAFPALVSKMGFRGLWCFLFFIMIFFFGFDTQLMMVETVTTALFDEFEILRRRYVPVIALSCFIMFLLGIPMTMQNGKQIFDMMDGYSSMHSLLLLGFLEVVIVNYIYGFEKIIKRIREDLKVWVPGPFYVYLAVSWKVLTPLSLLVLMCFSFYGEYKSVWEKEKDFDALFITGVVISFSVFVIVPLRAIYVFFRYVCCDMNFRWAKRSKLWQATNNFTPAYVRRGIGPDRRRPDLPEDTFYMDVYDENEGIANPVPPERQ